MELSPSWEAANCAATQELPSILWNPKVHYHVHKIPPLIPILRQINPYHPILSKIHYNIVHPPMSRSTQWSLSFWLSHQYPTCIPLLPHSCYMLCPSQSPLSLASFILPFLLLLFFFHLPFIFFFSVHDLCNYLQSMKMWRHSYCISTDVELSL
jgi:hypothetical protein